MKKKRATSRNSMVTQAILFDRNIFSETQAKNWLKEHKLKPSKDVHKTKKYLRYRIRNPKLFKKDSFRTIKLKKGIKAIIGKLKK